MTATRKEQWVWAIAAAVLLGLYLAWPELDLRVSAWFYRPDSGFWVADLRAVQVFHETVPWVGRALLLLSALAWLLGGLGMSGRLRRHWRTAAALCLSLTLGLGLLVHSVFKDHWGRARPAQVQAFGGPATFTSPLQPARECRDNCSFVSGHAGTGFALMAVGTLGAVARRRRWFWIGTLTGLALGAVRVAQGGHFLSDVLFGWLMLWGTGLCIRVAWVRARAWRQRRRASGRRAG
jgi:lipid A 4'-phosphatase